MSPLGGRIDKRALERQSQILGKSTKYKVQSTNESGKYKVRRSNNGWLIPNFVLRHSYIVLRVVPQ